ncbi:GNAT family N-acetyltransferase [Bellilinea sp.]|uniref:GNAT family N-acetyltransferase n=1 Tax=Bellilinea sp. TaxID=2838785 RepID=UPI002ADE886F|nr:GNAT family N-acetyltransferase [Bellilinea sp.]
MMDCEFVIRPFQKADRDALLKVAANTAFFGDPVEYFMEDRRIFLDAFYVYYTDHEPEHSWVATYEECVIGFLTGCFDTTLQREFTARVLEPKTLRGALSGKYRMGKKFFRYLLNYSMSKIRSPKNHLDLLQYPAHFHINIIKEWRGKGIGKNLIERFLDQLKAADICGVHLQTTSYNKAALYLYEKMGFQLLFSTHSYLWQNVVNEPIFELTYGMKL